MNLTNAQPDPAWGSTTPPIEVIFQEQDFQAAVQATGLAGMVTQDAFDLATGYDDPYATATFHVLNQVLIGDDRKLMGAQSFALAAPTTLTIAKTLVGSIDSTGGTVNVHVAAAGRTGSGYYYGSGNSQGYAGSTSFTVSSAVNSLTATVSPIRGAVAYDWFQSADGTTWYYYTTTTTNVVSMTKVISANQALPSSTLCPDMSTVWKGAAGVPTLSTSADNGSANANDYDGFLATLTGDYNGTGQWVTAGSGGAGGAANPSIWNNLGGAALTLTGGTVAEIEAYLFLPLWQQVKCSPTAIMVNAVQAQEVANLVLGSSSATTFLNTDAAGRVSVTAGGRVGELVNAPAGGVTVPIEVHTSLPPGTIVARTDRVPFPQANISSVLEYRALRDTAQFDYGISRIANAAGGGPRREFEIKSLGAFCNKAPVAMASLSCVG